MARKSKLGALLVTAIVCLAGCRAPGSAPPEEASGSGLPESLSEPPDRLPPEDRPAKDDRKDGGKKKKPEGERGDDRPGDAATPATPPDAPEETPAPAPRTRTLGEVSDARDDQGPLGPAYADLSRVTIAERGEAALILVDLGDRIPDRLEAGEVMGIGVDLFGRNSAESEYQLFADGGSDGWHAYLQGPNGFVDYPGSFAIGGARLAFEVPWRSVGGGSTYRFSAFVDWSSEGVAVNPSSSDLAPEGGPAGFR
jgi:hypothetical protein